MSRFSRLKMLFSITILFGLFDAITSNDDMFKYMTVEQKKAFFGNEDGSVPEFEVVQLPHPVRSKRSSIWPSIDITFNNTTTRLVKIRNNELISQSSTGIWFAKSNETAHNGVMYSPRPDLFNDIGDFELFQNSDDLSAVARFWNRRNTDLSLMGILQQTYIVKSIRLCSKTRNETPCYNLVNHKKRSTNSTENEDPNLSIYLVIYKLPEAPIEYFKRILGISNVPDLKFNRKKRQQSRNFDSIDTVYPKLLLSVDYFLNRSITINQYMRVLVTHINAVDTMYRTLQDPKVRLRVAGIIIPEDVGAVPYISSHYEPSGMMNAHNVLASTNSYFYKEFDRFPRYRYDVVLIMTERRLYNSIEPGYIHPLEGLGYMSYACTGNGTAITHHTTNFQGILVMAHELAHVLGSSHDGAGTSKSCKKEDGFAMAPGKKYAKFLTWSNCTREAFRTFFRSNNATCMLNRPDEVPNSVKGMPGAWFSIIAQCNNIFQNVSGYSSARQYCNSYECRVNDEYKSSNQPLLEGTLIMDNKRCIDGQWWG